MRLLLVEDDTMIGEVVLDLLRAEHYAVDWVKDGDMADTALQTQTYDLVLLDLGLPRKDGLEVLRSMRLRKELTPVLIATARDAKEQRIAGLDAGADDYLGKPFDLAEVEARLRALVRRAKGTEDIVLLGQLKLDRKARRFSTNSGPLDLPAREFEVLWELMSPPGRTVSKRALSDKLSSFDESLGDNALEAFISRLRKKLLGTGASIRTLRGIGYLLEAEV